jgi:hypothetical protein
MNLKLEDLEDGAHGIGFTQQIGKRYFHHEASEKC